jgi:hypothetical protein
MELNKNFLFSQLPGETQGWCQRGGGPCLKFCPDGGASWLSVAVVVIVVGWKMSS